jgi:hypothetical protein
MEQNTLTEKDIDWMLHFIDLLFLGRSEEICGKKQPVS